MRIFAAAILILSLLTISTTSASAHDERHHKGKPTKGVVEAVENDHFKLRTDKSTVTVRLTNDTVFESGDLKRTKEILAAGAKVSVFGTKLPGGEIVAKEILLRDEQPAQAGDSPQQ